MSNYTIMQKKWVVPCQVTATASPTLLKTLVATALSGADKIPDSITGVEITNNGGSAALYIGYDDAVSATRNKNTILSGAHYEDNINRAVFDNKLYIVTATGSVLVYVVLYGS